MAKYLVVIPAFNRDRSLKRLLESLARSRFDDFSFDLLISIDGKGDPKVVTTAFDFSKNFQRCNVNVKLHDFNLGLKKHIIWCGDQVKDYEAIIILEDDLLLSPNFWRFSKEAIDFYNSEDHIAGISLYSQRYNEYANLPFECNESEYSNYFMKIPSSWGQAWTKNQWYSFKYWLDNNIDLSLNLIPKYVSNWPETSWKKLFSIYLAETNKYFVYPYVSYTSNCADAGGQNTVDGFDLLEVPLNLNISYDEDVIFNFSKFSSKSSITYDQFMERENIYVPLIDDVVELDFYGTKSLEYLAKKGKYVISSNKQGADCFDVPLKFKPIENNAIMLFSSNINTSFLKLCSCKDLKYKSLLGRKLSYSRLMEYYIYSSLKGWSLKFTLLIIFLGII